jgi:SPOR domain
VSVSAPARAPARRRERCPNCEIPAQRGQLICLSCGTRLALDRGGSDKRAVAAAAGALALTALVSLGLILDALSGGEERPQAAERPSERSRAAARAAERQPPSAQRALWQYKARARRQLAASAGTWPAGRVGWTVILSSMSDEQLAQDFAKDVEDAGVDAGVLSTDEHPALGTGIYYVFAGVYDDELEAGEAAAELAASYPGAYTRYVE